MFTFFLSELFWYSKRVKTHAHNQRILKWTNFLVQVSQEQRVYLPSPAAPVKCTKKLNRKGAFNTIVRF